MSDVDVEIRMRRLPERRNGVLVEFGKIRDGASFGKVYKPFCLLWNRNSETGLMDLWSEEIEEGEKGSWAERPKQDAVSTRSINELYITAHFNGNEAGVIRCLARAHLRTPDVKRAEIQATLDFSPRQPARSATS